MNDGPEKPVIRDPSGNPVEIRKLCHFDMVLLTRTQPRFLQWIEAYYAKRLEGEVPPPLYMDCDERYQLVFQFTRPVEVTETLLKTGGDALRDAAREEIAFHVGFAELNYLVAEVAAQLVENIRPISGR